MVNKKATLKTRQLNNTSDHCHLAMPGYAVPVQEVPGHRTSSITPYIIIHHPELKTITISSNIESIATMQ